jgi:hypothetical protein
LPAQRHAKSCRILDAFKQFWVLFTWQQRFESLAIRFESSRSPEKFAKRFESLNPYSRIRLTTTHESRLPFQMTESLFFLSLDWLESCKKNHTEEQRKKRKYLSKIAANKSRLKSFFCLINFSDVSNFCPSLYEESTWGENIGIFFLPRKLPKDSNPKTRCATIRQRHNKIARNTLTFYFTQNALRTETINKLFISML